MFRKIFFLIVFVLSGLSSSQALAQLPNVQVRVEGSGVSIPDTINGLQAMVVAGSRITLILSAQSTVNITGTTIGFELYSPNNPNMTVRWPEASVESPSTLSGWRCNTIFLDTWDAHVWDGGGTGGNISANGILPDTFMTGGVSLGSPGAGFESDSLVDVVLVDLIINDTGVFCIDSSFFPPSGTWLMSPAGAPTWGGNPVGYPEGGYCITVYPQECCTTPGDANGDASVNIADVTYMIARILAGGPAPVCENEADADGSHSTNIGDVTFMIARIFDGGPAPHCFWNAQYYEPSDYIFLTPDTIEIACGQFVKTEFEVKSISPNATNDFDRFPDFTVVSSSSGIFGITLEATSCFFDDIMFFTTVSSGTSESITLRATSRPGGSGISTEKTIIITCP